MKKFFISFRKIFAVRDFPALLLFGAMLAAAFCLLLFSGREFSAQENRELQRFPGISWQSIADGSFMEKMSDFVSDQFPARDAFVALNTDVSFLEGNRDAGGNFSAAPAQSGAYFGARNHLYEMLLPEKSLTYRKNVSGLVEFAKKSGVPFYILPVPAGTEEQPENLPYGAPAASQRELFRQLQAAASGSARVVDLFDGLSLQKTGKDYYFKTDHHWNTYGAYVGYQGLCAAMKLPCTPVSQFGFRTAEQPFCGTLYSKAPLTWQQPDSFVMPFQKGGADLTQETNGTVRKGIYWDQYLTGKDKYSAYLGGNPAVTVIRNPSAAQGKLLILKDSYANSMVPYLASSFSEIHLVDLRYYNQDIYTYMKQNGITQAAAIYSISQLTEVPIANKLLR